MYIATSSCCLAEDRGCLTLFWTFFITPKITGPLMIIQWISVSRTFKMTLFVKVHQFCRHSSLRISETFWTDIVRRRSDVVFHWKSLKPVLKIPQNWDCFMLWAWLLCLAIIVYILFKARTSSSFNRQQGCPNGRLVFTSWSVFQAKVAISSRSRSPALYWLGFP